MVIFYSDFLLFRGLSSGVEYVSRMGVARSMHRIIVRNLKEAEHSDYLIVGGRLV
jgi:hypothetical protein